MIDIETQKAMEVLREKLNSVQADYERIVTEQKKREVLIQSLKHTLQSFEDSSELPSIADNTPKENSVNGEQYFFDRRLGLKEQIVNYMKYINRAVSSSDVVEVFENYNHGQHDRKKWMTIISGAFSIMVKEGVVKTYKPEKMKGYYYINPAWLDEEGNLNPDHKPKPTLKEIW